MRDQDSSPNAAPAALDEEDLDHDPLYPRQPEIVPAAEAFSPFSIDEDLSRLPCLFDAEGYPVILFDPVPLQRRRRHGWDEARQRLFVAILARVPSIRHAARFVGMSARSVYALLTKPGAEQFAKAIDMAIAFGRDRLQTDGLSRALEGEDLVPVKRRGRIVRYELRRNDKLAMSILNASGRDNDAFRQRSAQTRWRQAQEYAAMDADMAQRFPSAEEIERQVVDYIAKARMERRDDPDWGPRVRAI